MEKLFRTNSLPKLERLESWADHMFRAVAPMEIACSDPANFHGQIDGMDLGVVHVSRVRASPCEGSRTSRMIRQSDPEVFQLSLSLRGRVEINQDRKAAALSRSSDLVLYHSSRPSYVRSGVGGISTDGVMAVFPRTVLHLPAHKVEKLIATSFSGREGIAALLAGFLTELTAGTHHYAASARPHLGDTLIDLLVSLLAERLDSDVAIPPESQQNVLMMRIRIFIQRHLGDPALDVAAIAAAHNISVRTLHRLFQSQGIGAAAWIRAQRLERCRRDLCDRAQADRPIRAIAARWGYTDAASFSRAFHAAYGFSPRDYRHKHTASSARRADAPR
ncbi:helix-turn-helix domain-containing protein [Microbispora sp. RL4-1S]|uniref:Helix-turn-helix domain-containing protein n=2 Tax=Microbispora oryzae TaxID=2806554 RepID=A0A940WU65_9ACTN|nr:helix-turn-helix domain-containing protein [Microbispora oryzae]